MVKTEYRQVNIGEIVESPINAQVMAEKEFSRLVKNLKRDGGLTATVLLMHQSESDRLMCISGHHRIRACKKAGINEVPAMIIPELSESDRIRLQLSHNDIHGEPDIEIVHELLALMQEVDKDLVGNYGQEQLKLKELEEISDDQFRYVSVCMKPESANLLMGMIESIDGDEKLLIDKDEFEDMKIALTKAFKAGFKTPGRAFRRFLDIVLDHEDELEN